MKHYNWIRFDWAMKRLLRNKANFSILEGFLSELLKRDIKIIRILESEGNPAYYNDKYNRVDVLAEDQTGEIFIIEVQNQTEYDFFYRMAYGTAKAITDYLNLGQPYSKIRKIYSVNIMYFDLGQGEDYVYHGTTDFYGIHKKDKLLLSKSQKIEYDMLEPRDMFPEYYVLKVNAFDDIAKDSLDEWMYYFKNNEIKDTFKAQGLKQAKEILKIDQLPKDERIAYKRHMEDLSYKASMVETQKIDEKIRLRKALKEGREEGLKQGIEKGLEKGLEKGITIVAKKMKDNGMDIDQISTITGLSKDEIEKL